MARFRFNTLISMLIALYAALTISCYTPAGRSPGDVVDDAAITAQVKSELLADQGMTGIAISVSTFQGEVTLTGAVKNEMQMKKAVAIAQSARGAHKVTNLIKIQP